VTYEADFDFNLDMVKEEGGSLTTIEVKEGSGQFCLKEPGLW